MKYLILFNALVFTLISLAQGPNAYISNDPISLGNAKSLMNASKSGFEENKGQVTGEDANKVNFVYKSKGMSVFLLNSGISYQFRKIHFPEGYKIPSKSNTQEEREKSELLEKDIRVESYRMDVLLKGANPSPVITREGKSTDYTQYYNHNALNVHNYSKIIYHNVYPKIDWVIYKNGGNLKYDFIVHPGGNPKNIQLVTKWVEGLELNANGELMLSNRMGKIIEEQPISFQEGKEIKTSFVLNENEISFDIQNYDPTKELIIDPIVRMWGTYYGGSDYEEANDCATDASGNVFMAGLTISFSAIGSGGFDNSFGGGLYDAFLVKFNAAGVRQWGTYYGGSDSDFAYGCATDASGNSFMCGPTYSTSSIASGGFQNTHAAGSNNDAFLVKFDAAGARLWATYYGGTNFDNGDACATDPSGNIYMTGGTQSGGLATAGTHQTGVSGGFDAYLAKFNSSGGRVWCTYYGGGSDERYVYGCTTDPSGNPYIAGRTQSTTNVASAGAHQTSFGGGGAIDDAFLAKFNTTNGTRLWGTYYGTATYDYANDCSTDASGNVYMAGGSSSTTNIASGGHQNSNGGSTDGFLVKFNSAGARQWGTYYGGATSDVFQGCGTDASGNVFATGSTNSSTNIASSGYQNSLGGGTDGMIVKFNSAGARQWGTYYGGTDNEMDGSCAIDASGNAYLGGTTASTTDIASGGHQLTYGGGTDDAYLVKFADCVPETNTTSSSSICESQTLSLTSSLSGAGAWSIVSGGGSISGTTYTPADVSSNTSVTVRYTDGCSTASDVTFTVNVLVIANNTTSTASICEGSTVALVASPAGGTWSVVSGGGSISGTTYTSPSIASNTNVTVRYTIPANGGCASSTSDATFTVNDNLGTASNATSTASICEGSTVALVATPAGGTWSVVSGGGTISGTTYTSPSIASNTNVTVRYTIATNDACAGSTSDATFTVNDNPGTANNTTSTASICEGSTVALASSPAGGAWSVVSGGGTISGTTYTSPSVGSNTNVTVRYTIPANGACAATTSDATFTVGDNLGTASNTTSTASICEGSTVALAASPAGGTWSVVSGGGTISGTTYTSPSVASNTNVTVRYAIAANAGCTATTSDATFTVGDNLGTANNTTSTASICEGLTVALAATPAGGTWSVVSGGGTISGTTYTSPSVASNTNVTVRYTIPANAGCVATTSDATFIVTDNPGVANNTTSTASVCEGSTVALTSTPAGGTWSVVSGGGSISGTTYTSPSVGSNTSVTVRYTMPASGGCASSTSDAIFTVNDNLGTASNTTSTVSICEGSTVVLVATPAGGTWSVVSGGGTISGTTYTSPSIASNTNVTVRYTIATNGACAGTTSDATFIVNDNPGTANNTTSTASICEGSTVALAASPAGGTWNVVSGGGTISGTTYTSPSVGSNTNVTVRYTIPANGACAATTSDATFTVGDNLGTASNTTSTASICEGSTVALAASPAGGTWSVVSGGGTISGTTYTSPSIASNTNVTVRYTIAANAGCTATTSDATFTVGDNLGTANNTTSTASICEGLTVALAATPAGGTWSVVSGGGTISGTTYTSPSVASNTNVTVRYIIPANGACVATTSDVTFTVGSQPISGTLSGLQNICASSTTTFTSTEASGSWLSANTAVATVDPSTGVISGIAGGTSVISYTVAGSGGCPDSIATRLVMVEALPYLSDFHASLMKHCVEDSFTVSLAIESTSFPVNYWIYNTTDTIVMSSAENMIDIIYYDSLNIAGGSYTVSLESASSCFAVLPVTIGEALLNLQLDSLGLGSITCFGDSTDVYVRIQGGIGPYDYYLISGTDTVDYQQVVLDSFVVFQNLPVGNYTVNVVDLGQIPWYHLIGGTLRERGSLYQDNNGEFLMVGGTESTESSLGTPIGGIDGFIIKLDAQGHILWKKRYGTLDTDYLMNIKQMANGEYVATGYKKSLFISEVYTNYDIDIWFLRLDQDGNVLADETYIAPGYDSPREVVELPSGDLIIVGGSRSNGGIFSGNHGGLEDAFAIRTNPIGQIIWTRLYGSTGQDGFSASDLLADGSILVSGWCGANDGDVTGYHGGYWDAWVVRIDQAGNIVTQYPFGGTDYEYFNVIERFGSDIYLLGTTASSNGDITAPVYGGSDGIAVRYDETTFAIAEQIILGGSTDDDFSSIIPTTDGGFLTVGSKMVSSEDGWLTRLNSTGQIIFEETYGGSNGASYYATHEGFGGIVKSNSDYIIDGTYASADGDFLGNHGMEDLLVMGLGAYYCDVASFQITQPPLYVDSLEVLLCAGDSYQLGSNFYSLPGFYVDTLVSAQGCDSIIYLNLVMDSIAPTIASCIQDSSIALGAGCTLSVPDFTTDPQLLVIDNCGDVLNGTLIITQSPLAGTSLGVGMHTVMIYATDNNSNVDSCSFVLTIFDSIAPTFVNGCIADTILYSGTSTCEVLTPDFTSSSQLVITDNCGDVLNGTIVVIQSPSAGTLLGIGSHIITVYATDNNSNIDSCSFTVQVSDTISPIVTVSVSSPFCDGDPVNWTAVITDNCGLPTVTSTHNSGDVFPIGTTTVTYTATDASGNTTTESFDVFVNALPTVSLAATLMNVCSSESVTLLVTNPDTSYVYDWTFGNGPVIYTGPNYTIANPQKANTGYYQVTATNSLGCAAMDEVHLIVEDCEIVVYQTFSPDNNGQNEYFFIEGLESFPNTSVTILNRWGTKVYHSDDYKNDWHGTSESQYNVGGDELPEGTYFYLLELGGDPADDTYHKVYKGYVYLKR